MGGFDLDLTSIKVQSFNVSAEDAKLGILEGFFHLSVTQVEARITFHWHWWGGGTRGYRLLVTQVEAPNHLPLALVCVGGGP